MEQKIALRASLVFFFIYGLLSLFGSIFLVSWGGSGVFKRTLLFFSSVPFDWNQLIVKSLWFMLLNIVFWSFAVYIIVFFIVRLVRRIGDRRV